MPPKSRHGPPCVEQYGPPDVSAPRTYVVFGMPRGGTSMVGGLARLCGLPMGEGLTKNHEDAEFNVDWIRRRGEQPLPAIKAAIDRRNAEHEVWGWKYPRATRYLDDIRTHLRNPHLIVVLRDPVAAAGRHTDPDGSHVRAVGYLHELQSVNLELVDRWQVPSLLVSYERGTARPIMLVRQLADFLGLPVPQDRERIRAFVRPGTYQALP